MFDQLHKVLDVLEECSQRTARLQVSVSDFDDKLELVRYNRLAIAELGKLIHMMMEANVGKANG